MNNYDVLKLKDLIDNNNDIRLCREYYTKIVNGDYSCVNDALVFTNKKYDELLLTDYDLVAIKGIVNIGGTVAKAPATRALDNLKCINDLLVAKVIREFI